MQCHQVLAPLTFVQVNTLLNVQPFLQLPELLLSIHYLDHILFYLILDPRASWLLPLLRNLPVFSILIKEHLLHFYTLCVLVVVSATAQTQALDVQVLRLPLQVTQVVALYQLRLVATLITSCALYEFLVEDQGRPLQGLRTVNDKIFE